MAARLRQLGVTRSVAGMLAVIGIAALAVVGSRGLVPGPAPAPGVTPVVPAPRVTAAPAAGPASEDPASPRSAVPLRNPFRYAEERPALRLPPPPPLSGPAVASSTPAPIRFLGLVRRGGTVKAALAVSGDVLLAAPGEEVAGYVVLSLGEDAVMVKGPEGGEIHLRLPR